MLKIPGSTLVVHGVTPSEKTLLEKRAKFNLEYMKEKGWGKDVSALTMGQVMEMTSQDGWKTPE